MEVMWKQIYDKCNKYHFCDKVEDKCTAHGVTVYFLPKQVLHSGIPVTLIPLDATNTIPVSKDFFSAFESRQDTYEAQYCFQSLKMIRDTWVGDRFHEVIS